jgi:hypothetical protein
MPGHGPYAGYLLFLFGIADATAASWMREQLVALDSLTGPDIAGVVFVKRIGINAQITSVYTPHPIREKVSDGTVDLCDIEFDPFPFHVTPMLGLDESDRFEQRTAELQAITYATDDIARAFSVLADLPCLIIADAVPTQQIEVLRLQNGCLSNIVPLLRAMIGHFYKKAGIQRHLKHLRRLEHLSEDRKRLGSKIAEVEYQSRSRINTVNIDAGEPLRKACHWLRLGSAKGFVRELASAPFIATPARDNAVAAARHNAARPNQYSKTIGSLSWYTEEFDWPLDNASHHRIVNILNKYVRQLLPDAPHIIDTDTYEEWQRLRARLQISQAELISVIWGALPTADEVRLVKQTEIDALQDRRATAWRPSYR